MKIAVCIKQVPEREDCGMDPEQGVLVREGSMTVSYTHLDVYKRQH